MCSRLYRLAATIAIAASASGCASSYYPLSGEKDSVADKQLIGIWTPIDAGIVVKEETRLKVESKPGSETALLVTPDHPAYKERNWTLRPTKLAKRRFLSINNRTKEGMREKWIIAEYQWTNPDLFRLRILDAKQMRKEVEAGKLNGVVEVDQFPKEGEVPNFSVFLDEKPENLRKYIERNNTAFPDDWLSFKRVKESK
jgi:hypothetical protein